MAITRIRGGQIQDRTIDGIKIKQNALLNEHVASNAAIHESKLDINWSAHTEVLENKKVLDYVQINEQLVEGVAKFDVSAIVGGAPAVLSVGTEEGIVVDEPKNEVVVRDAVTGDPILGVNGGEVFGRMEFTPTPDEGVTPDKFEIAFYEIDSNGDEVAFTMPTGQKAKFQYLRRFNLLTVDEMFAANEKFVDGTADTNARLDLQQLAKDLYGNSWSLDHDGAVNLSRSLVDEILAQTSGVINSSVRASEIIDEVVEARGTFESLDARLDNSEATLADVENEVSVARGSFANLDARLDAADTKDAEQDAALAQEIADRQAGDTAIKTDLSSTDATVAGAGKGAEMVGVRDVAGKFTATTVEGVLAEIEGRVGAVESGAGASNQEIVDARDSVLTGAHADLDARLEAGETKFSTDIAAEKTRAEAAEAQLTSDLAAEVTRATTKESALQGEIDAVETDLAGYKTSNDTRVGQVETDLAAEVTRATAKEDALQGEIDAVEADLAAHKTAQATKDSEQDSRLTALEAGGGAEVEATHTRDTASLNGYYAAGSFTDLEARIVDVETIADAQFKSLQGEIDAEETARQSADTTLQGNIDAEATRAQAAEAQLTSDLAAEKTAREAADATLTTDLASEVTRATNKENAIEAALTQEIADRQAADATIKSDLASTATGKGASTVGIEDAAGLFTATQVEAALAELYNKIENDTTSGSEAAEQSANLRTKELESVGVKFGGEVAPQTGMVLDVPAAIVYNAEGERFETTAGTVTIGAADATNPRIDVVYVDALGVVQVAQGVAGATPSVPTLPAGAVKLAEVSVPANATEITEVADKRVFVGTGSEVQAARGSMATVDARLSVSLNADGTLKSGAQIHDHKKHIEQIVAQTNVVNMPTGEHFQADGTLNVYVNGILQANGVNFTEVYDANGNGIAVDFGTDPVLVGDVVIFTYVVNNAI